MDKELKFALSEGSFLKRRALQICEEALDHHLDGRVAKAIPIYAKSIRILPTAEAHCYLGWAYASTGKIDYAVQECLKAISIDADFGNPYNDIGSYLVRQGKVDEAIAWFEKAKKAKRSDTPHYPYVNLGRVYTARGMVLRAIREFEKALELKPNDEGCKDTLKELRLMSSR